MEPLLCPHKLKSQANYKSIVNLAIILAFWGLTLQFSVFFCSQGNPVFARVLPRGFFTPHQATHRLFDGRHRTMRTLTSAQRNSWTFSCGEESCDFSTAVAAKPSKPLLMTVQCISVYYTRIHGAAIYGNIGNIYQQYTPFMLVYIPAPWILWGVLYNILVDSSNIFPYSSYIFQYSSYTQGGHTQIGHHWLWFLY